MVAEDYIDSIVAERQRAATWLRGRLGEWVLFDRQHWQLKAVRVEGGRPWAMLERPGDDGGAVTRRADAVNVWGKMSDARPEPHP